MTLTTVGDTLREFASSCKPHLQQEASPERRACTAKHLQKNETYLHVNTLVALLDLFQKETEYTDTYLTIEREDLCKAWIAKRLGEMGILLPPSDSMDT